MKITDPSNENNINVINAVKEPFFAILIFSFSGNLSVIIIKIGEIPIGFIRVNKVVRQKIEEVEERDRIRNFQPPVSGEMIMDHFNLRPCKEIGLIKEAIKEAILEGEIPNEYNAAFDLMKKKGSEIGLESPKSKICNTIDESKNILNDIGLPLIIRPSFTLGGSGGGVAKTEKEYFQIEKSE